MSAGSLAANTVFHAHTKHIEIDAHFIREKVAAKVVEVRYIPTTEQVDDILSKELTIP